MKIMLQTRGICDDIGHDDAELQEERMALRAVPLEMISTLVVNMSAKEAWDVVKTIHVGVDHVHMAA